MYKTRTCLCRCVDDTYTLALHDALPILIMHTRAHTIETSLQLVCIECLLGMEAVFVKKILKLFRCRCVDDAHTCTRRELVCAGVSMIHTHVQDESSPVRWSCTHALTQLKPHFSWSVANVCWEWKLFL